MSQVGRISGPLLDANLQRDNNLAFETDLLFFDISTNRVGIKTSAPETDLRVVGKTLTTDGVVTNTALFDNVYFNAVGSITSYTGPVTVAPQGVDPYLNFDRLQTGKLSFNGNLINSYESPNGNVIVRTGGAIGIDIENNARVNGNLEVTGNIGIDGNLSSAGNIIVGDSIYDAVTFTPDFTQDIIPGQDLIWNLGIDANDSTPRYWNNVYAITAYFSSPPSPNQLTISDQLFLDGTARTITTLQSNDNLLLTSDTGVIRVEQLEFETNYIRNLEDTPITFSSTGLGYYKFAGTAGVVIPAGTDAQRPVTFGPAQAGATRWNSEQGFVEVWDGTEWIISTGPGIEVLEGDMIELGNIYSLILA